jgi:hypothetical protein
VTSHTAHAGAKTQVPPYLTLAFCSSRDRAVQRIIAFPPQRIALVLGFNSNLPNHISPRHHFHTTFTLLRLRASSRDVFFSSSSRIFFIYFNLPPLCLAHARNATDLHPQQRVTVISRPTLLLNRCCLASVFKLSSPPHQPRRILSAHSSASEQASRRRYTPPRSHDAINARPLVAAHPVGPTTL